ncbi:hypothetical protein DFA_09638 [Cavenderia fasciculata]|uniref:Uncharacterized protein n=1 Tax=Cavenderia fasciculata TaxID=261658 RepID=F4Q867_CACFS|nr:uncharacterized protein DFA_09638 [Cavenderia fasciculata]EGG15967.1 hypothetical protein DFA_09638 [Cavenderia fasciculata]|eukprot:XP_004352292.1 hypothetical protein DFA_09638 [Cavenderia fasciculata]
MKTIKGIIFDLDGTLTLPVMDFGLLRRNLGLHTTTRDVLEAIKDWTPEQQVQGHKIIHDFEMDARNKLVIQPGASELMQLLETLNIKKAIHSRNNLANITYFQDQLGYKFDPLVGREIEPPKPNPAGCQHISKHWLIDAKDILFIGDSKDDLLTSKAFGSCSVLLVNEHNDKAKEMADLCVNSLEEFRQLIENGFFIGHTVSGGAKI